MQGGWVSAYAAAIATLQAPAMRHRAIAIVQAPAVCQRAIATVQASAMCHCQKLSAAGLHTSGVPHACFLGGHRRSRFTAAYDGWLHVSDYGRYSVG